MQNEITKSSDLLDSFGQLVQKGWARKLILKYNRENISAGWSRIKEWDYLVSNQGMGLLCYFKSKLWYSFHCSRLRLYGINCYYVDRFYKEDFYFR